MLEEIIAGESLGIRELDYNDYLNKLFDKGYKSDDFTEINFM